MANIRPEMAITRGGRNQPIWSGPDAEGRSIQRTGSSLDGALILTDTSSALQILATTGAFSTLTRFVSGDSNI